MRVGRAATDAAPQCLPPAGAHQCRTQRVHRLFARHPGGPLGLHRPVLVHQVVLNLVANAVTFGGDGPSALVAVARIAGETAPLLFTAFGASLIGHNGYYYLLQRYEVSLIAPLSLLSPILGVVLEPTLA